MTPVESSPSAPPQTPLATRSLAAIGRFLVTAGVVVLAFVAFQLWGTNVQEARAQDDLREDFEERLATAQAPTAVPDDLDPGSAPGPPEPAAPPTLPGGIDPASVASFSTEQGDPVARIEIPSIDVDKIVVSGVQVADLRKGPGHYPGTAMVGTPGNTSIAGHRTTYGSPFNRIDELAPGDEIHVTGVLGRFTYRVLAPEPAFATHRDAIDGFGIGHVIVAPSATWVLADFGDNRLTLTACHPKLSSRQRIIVAAERVDPAADTVASDPTVDAGPAEVGEPRLADDYTPEAEVDAGEPTSSAGAPTDSLDEGLDGDRDAIPGAVLWMLAAAAIWFLAGVVARRRFDERRHRIAVRLAGLVPALICLWFSFEMIDRALPAG